jgi:hypothetical protein
MTPELKKVMEEFPLAIINASDDELWFFVGWLNEEFNSRGYSELEQKDSDKNKEGK